MISAIIQEPGTAETFIFGLSEMNIKRLKAGEPIHITPETHGQGCPPGIKILIVYGEERELYDTMKQAGLITGQTTVKLDPRFGKP